MATVASPAVSFTDDFFKSAYRLAPNESRLVFKAMELISKDPNHPSLNLHPLHQDRRLYTARVTQELRMLVHKEGSVYLLLEVGHHDDIYARADRGRLIVNAGTGFIGYVERQADHAPANESVAKVPDGKDDGQRVFDHWTDPELMGAGFSEADVAELRSVVVEAELLDLGLHEERLLRAIEVMATTPEAWRHDDGGQEHRVTEAILRGAIETHGALYGLSPLYSPDELARLAAAPIEQWMVFLHPDQRTLASRRFEGPARVRGAAGTGKTVVALHRAAYLARRYPAPGTKPQILFTTFVKSLAPVLERLYQRIPEARDGQVEFSNVDRLALPLFYEGGGNGAIDPQACEAAFASAWRTVAHPTSPIGQSGLSRQYLQDEIRVVIRGRALWELEDYLELERTGRRTRFTGDLRRNTWELMEAWDSEKAERNVVDFPDVVLGAIAQAERQAAPRYRAAVIDEAQDLSLASLLLIRTLVNGPDGFDRSDNIFIVGDGAQRVYPGGYSLRAAGVEVRGRTTVLRTNYRNSREILAAAAAVAGKDEVDDLDVTIVRGDEWDEPHRRGPKPELLIADDADTELTGLSEAVAGCLTDGVGMGDVGVFVNTNRAVQLVLAALDRAGVGAVTLDKYDGEESNLVKVGTYLRAKGLEFKVVFLPFLSGLVFPRPSLPGQDPGDYQEQCELERARLFVAMTRARDRLVITCAVAPAPTLVEALGSFAERRIADAPPKVS